ncbi:MAG: 4-(cytidine 5'-diphospho)-2-C-methyl-D-erythritol kinase [Actinomycetota bacterium]|nr:4-(cytidine 5'-diphospho)-2-C-methyl-D-erythritol kinase [Actinomycetota bacterium]
MSVTARAPAKINLHLAVGPLGEDGFHPLVTVFQAISVYDDVAVTDASGWSVELVSVGDIDCAGVPLDERNIAVRAGRLLAEHHCIERAAAITIAKGIPAAGGMAGGSADAAATLVALDRLWELDTTDADLLALAARLGSDVPFALLGGTALGTGRGDRLERLVDNGAWWWLVIGSERGLATPRVYRELDRLRPGHPEGFAADPVELRRALAGGESERLRKWLRNDLQQPALSLRSDLADTVSRLSQAGMSEVLVSGSGPTLLVPADNQEHARTLHADLLTRGLSVVAVATAPVAGAHVVEYA